MNDHGTLRKQVLGNLLLTGHIGGITDGHSEGYFPDELGRMDG